jgi:hypothetical protein
MNHCELIRMEGLSILVAGRREEHQCVKTLTAKWSSKLAGFDVYVWDQCYAMEQSLSIE